MNKVIAILCAALLLAAVMAPALAEKSPGELDTEAISIEVDAGVELKPQQKVAVKSANPASYESIVVAGLVSSVNNITYDTAVKVAADDAKTEVVMTSSTAANADGTKTISTKMEITNAETGETAEKTEETKAADPSAANVTVKDVVDVLRAENVEDVDKMDFVSKFSDVAVVDGDDAVYEEDGQSVGATITIRDDALTGLDREDLDNYRILLINTVTGEVRFLKMEMDEAGNITAYFPFMGTFCVVQVVG